jgi:hypothetical protein
VVGTGVGVGAGAGVAGAAVVGAAEVGAGVVGGGVRGGAVGEGLGLADGVADGDAEGAARAPSWGTTNASEMAAMRAIAPDRSSPEPMSASPPDRRGAGASGAPPSRALSRRSVSSLIHRPELQVFCRLLGRGRGCPSDVRTGH